MLLKRRAPREHPRDPIWLLLPVIGSGGVVTLLPPVVEWFLNLVFTVIFVAVVVVTALWFIWMVWGPLPNAQPTKENRS